MANPTQIKNVLIKALNSNSVPPSVLVSWFEKSMEPAAKEALTAEGMDDVNKNLVSEADYNKMENDVKDSLNKQKAKLQSEFNNLLTQVNLKDPEEAQKMFPSDIRKQFDATFTKELERATREAQKEEAEEKKQMSSWQDVCRTILLLLGSPTDDNTEDNKAFNNALSLANLPKPLIEKLKKYHGQVHWNENDMNDIVVASNNITTEANVEKMKSLLNAKMNTVKQQKSNASPAQQKLIGEIAGTLKVANLSDRRFEELLNKVLGSSSSAVDKENKTETQQQTEEK